MIVETKYGEMDKKVLKNYLEDKVGKIYKILPLYESNCSTLKTYIQSLNAELYGARELFKELHANPNFISVMATLEYLEIYLDNINKTICKREVFKCIRLIKQIIKM